MPHKSPFGSLLTHFVSFFQYSNSETSASYTIEPPPFPTPCQIFTIINNIVMSPSVEYLLGFWNKKFAFSVSGYKLIL